MTNGWVDIKHTDVALIIGSNPAENHPISFKWLLDAREKRGAKLIHMDPRFGRTSAVADHWAPLRPGTDIPFIGGMINYIIENNLMHHDYVVNYTNATFMVSDDFDFQDGLFTGYDEARRRYTDRSSWSYELDENGVPRRDWTMTHPRSVFQLLKKHFARYDVDTVCATTGTPKDKYLEVVRTYAGTGAPDKVGTIMYAMGTTQHTVGTQNVRSYAILQLLLGNVGRPGGGVQALRGKSNVQGATDMAILYHIIPGYMRVPRVSMATLADYFGAAVPSTNDPDSVNYWKNMPKFLVSLLKAWYGDKATPENDFGYDWLPKLQDGKDASHIGIFEDMYEGKIQGLFCVGQNPAVGGPNAKKERKALTKLKWMVVADIFECDSAVFWKSPGIDPKDVETEVFLLPTAASMEKQGTVSNSARWLQWRYAAQQPPGDARSDLKIFTHLVNKIKELYAGSTDPKDEPVLNLTWNYGDPPSAEEVLKEIHGYDLKTGKPVLNFTRLMDDGSTSCGNWIYSGCFTEDGVNLTKRRNGEDPGGIGIFPQWTWAWPVNRRIAYNRCSADVNGQPWDPARAPFRWDASQGRWIMYDVPDFVAGVPPQQSAKSPFIMRLEGVGCLFSRELNEGPFPEHYEPWETPIANAFSSVQLNPAVQLWGEADNAQGSASEFPIIGTTFRVTEHWQSGTMTRNTPWLAELMPEVFVEISPQLAQEKGIQNGDAVLVTTARADLEAKAAVTSRIAPMTIHGREHHVIAVPWHYGFAGYITGGPNKQRTYAANELTAHIGDANTTIPEYKAFLCDIRKVT